MAVEQTDVVIIGSGYGGSINAARLAAAGMQVVVLERGERLSSRDFRQSDDPRYIRTVIDFVVASDNVAFRTGKLVGGASIPMDGAHFRMPQKSFDVTDGTGRRYWPDVYSRASMDPYYDKAEAMIGIRQFAWDEIPKAGGLFAKMLDAAGASCERARMNYTDCIHCGFCSQGCPFGKKNNLLRNYIPFAETHGAEFRAGCSVDEIEPDGAGGYLVRYHAGLPREPRTISAPRVIVAGGGIHSSALLLRSARFLPDISEHVGENFNNNGEHSFIGILPPEFDDLSTYNCYKGADNAAVMSFHWMDSEGFTLHPGGGLEPTLFAASLAAANHPVLPSKAWGMEYKRWVESVYPHRVIAFSALGLSDGHRAISVSSSGTVDLINRDRTAYDAYLDRLESIVIAAGAISGVTLLSAVPRRLAGLTSAHLLSACRMGDSKDTGVVDEDCQVYGYPNLYVCDASAVPYALAVNPALTISAIAERTAERIVARG
jgi:enediyne biosynthesis protein E9